MATVINSFAVSGVNAYPVEVETVTLHGQPSTTVVGLGDTSVKESRQRFEAALMYAGYEFPKMKIVINLAPSALKKSGSHFDLAMAVGLLNESGQLQVSPEELNEYGLIGELSLNAQLRSVNGVLPMAVAARDVGIRKLIVPVGNLKEASLVHGLQVFAFQELKEVVKYLEGKELYLEPSLAEQSMNENLDKGLDFADVQGQDMLIEYIVVAAAGGHNMLMIGPPGCGKSMIAKRIPTILPDMSEEEALGITKIYSVAGLLRERGRLISERPFRAPHHNASTNALVGGGSPVVPGEISLAHNGVLFLDEIAEFEKKALDALRQPMEDKEVTVSRVNSTQTFPSDFMLVAAMNPCPCGYHGLPKCRCSDYEVLKYRHKISGPVMDRIDVQKYVNPVDFLNLSSARPGKSSLELRDRVQFARLIQQGRFANLKGVNCNAQMNEAMVREFCHLDEEGNRLMRLAFDRYNYSARTYQKFLKLARTAADLDGSLKIRRKDVSVALMSRDIDKESAGMLVI
ncbi:YifB family Mg chelatase-like AAA ATPase [Paradesulfitobacterium aromaticivorans]